VSAQAPQGARDAESCRRRPDLESPGNRVVRQLADHAQLEGLALVLRETVEGRRQREAGREPLLDLRVPLVRGEVERQPEPLVGTRLDAIEANRLPQDVPGDPEKPGERGTGVLVAKAIPPQPRLRTSPRSGRSRPTRAGGTPPVNPDRVQLVQDSEGGRVCSRCPDQLRVRAVVRVDLHASL
jgi:hypothetical protein